MSSIEDMGPLELQEALDKDFEEGTQLLIEFSKDLKKYVEDKEMLKALDEVDKVVAVLTFCYYKTKEHMGKGMLVFIAENEELKKTIKELKNKYES